MNELKERILEELQELPNTEQIQIHNAWCEAEKYYDDYIERVDDIDELYSGFTPLEILERFSGINMAEDYYIINGYGHAESFDYYDTECPCQDFQGIADYCARNQDSLDNARIQEVIDEWLEEQEEPEYESEEDAAWSNGGEEEAMERYYESKGE